MFPIVCFKWKSLGTGYQLPTAVEYTAHHVNVLNNMLKRNHRRRFKLYCITDDPYGIDRGINVLPLWETYRSLGGCFNRLYLFSKDMKALIGPRFLCVDLDCVIVGDITNLILRKADFVMNSYKPLPSSTVDQHYNGSMMLMTAGAREQVWSEFDPEHSPAILKGLEERKVVIGSDQAWIRYKLGKGEKRFTEQDGVYEYRQVKNNLPENARIIFFSGHRDPSLRKDEWVTRLWK